MISNIAIFPHATFIPYQDFLHGHILFHLENPDPVEKEMISNPIQIQKYSNIRPDWTPKSGSCTPLLSVRQHQVNEFVRTFIS